MRELWSAVPRSKAGGLTATGPAMWPEVDRASAERRAASLAGALARYGLDADRRVAIVAPATPETLIALAAADRCGARASLVDPRLPDAALLEVLRGTGATLVMAGGEATLRRIVALRPELDAVELLIALIEPPAEGRPLPALSVAALVEDDAILPTAGAAAEPGFDVVGPDGSVRTWTSADLARAAGEWAGGLALTVSDTVIVRLDTVDRGWAPAVAAALSKGAAIVLDDPVGAGFEATLCRCRPTVAFVRAGDLAACRRSWEEQVAAAPWFQRTLHAWAIERGARPETRPWVRAVADRLVLASFRDRLGGRLRRLVPSDTPIDGETARFFASIGISHEGTGS